jgi:hypothetical protein
MRRFFKKRVGLVIAFNAFVKLSVLVSLWLIFECFCH